MHYYYGPMDGTGWGWGLFGMFLWLVFLAVVVVVLVRVLRGHNVGPSQTAGPLDIARERYAKGDITKEQFEQLKKDLK